MTEQELKRENFIAKAMANKENFERHKQLIEKHLCVNKFPPVYVKYFEKDLSVEDKMFVEDLKNFAERRVVDNFLLIKLMEYAEEYASIFKYDFSKGCKCDSRIGETWCCNQCGLPVSKAEL